MLSSMPPLEWWPRLNVNRQKTDDKWQPSINFSHSSYLRSHMVCNVVIVQWRKKTFDKVWHFAWKSAVRKVLQKDVITFTYMEKNTSSAPVWKPQVSDSDETKWSCCTNGVHESYKIGSEKEERLRSYGGSKLRSFIRTIIFIKSCLG